MRLKRTEVSRGARVPANIYTLPAVCIFGCFKSSKSTGVRLILRVNSLFDCSVVFGAGFSPFADSSSSATTEPVNTGEGR